MCDYESWIYTKIEDVIFEHHLMDEIYEFYHTEDTTDKIVKGRLGNKTKFYRVWRTIGEEWVFKEIEYE
jgi:hypothetical protein